jgi:hypothetical protein
MQVIHVDLDKFKTIERKTEGWTDEQITAYPLSALEAQIKSAHMTIETMEKSIADQRERIRSLETIASRKRVLGG